MIYNQSLSATARLMGKLCCSYCQKLGVVESTCQPCVDCTYAVVKFQYLIFISRINIGNTIISMASF